VAARSGIPPLRPQLSKPFAEKGDRSVYCELQKKGWTPNPCINCNRYIKFNALMKRAKQLGSEANWRQDGAGRMDSCFHRRNHQQDQLRLHTGGIAAHDDANSGGVISKDETRRWHEYGCVQTRAPRICFVRDGDYRDFLAKSAPETLAAGKFLRRRKHGAAFYWLVSVTRQHWVNDSFVCTLLMRRRERSHNRCTDEGVIYQDVVEDLTGLLLPPLPVKATRFMTW